MQAELFDDDDPFKHLDWPKAHDRSNPAFDGLSSDLLDVICDASITPEMTSALWRILADWKPHTGQELIRRLAEERWWRKGNKRSTDERFLRRIFDTALARGYPVCSSNEGYQRATREMLLKAEQREEALSRGAHLKGQMFGRAAERLAGLSAD